MNNTDLWWQNRDDLVAFARWMVEEGRIDIVDQLDVIEKPTKFAREYAEMCRALTAERALRLLSLSA
jgi:hypothetical protein